MKIAFLVGSYVPHQLASINSLIDNYDCEILSYSISEKFKFIPEKNARYVYQFDFEKGSYPSNFYKISSNGDKTPIPLARCKSYPFSP